MNKLEANVNELVGAAVRLPPPRPMGDLGMTDPMRLDVKPPEDLR